MRNWVRLLTLVLMLTLTASLAFAQDGDDEAVPTGEVPDLPLTANYTYTIVAGDTLDELAALFDVQLSCLRDTNDITALTIIQPDDELLIDLDCPNYSGILSVDFPRDTVFNTTTTPGQDDSDAGQGGGGSYVVQAGDTLDTIAQAFDVSVVSLQRLNELENSRIDPGQLLVIPDDGYTYGQFPPTIEPLTGDGSGQGGGVAGEIYVVQRNDTFDTIAQEFDISVVQLRRDNGFENSSVILPGQQLIVAEEDNRTPYGQFPPTIEPLTGDGSGQGGGVAGEIYVVQRNDTFDTIAQAFDISVVQLRRDNGFENSSVILPGQQLIVAEEDNRTPYGQFPPTIEPVGGDGQGGGIDGEIYVVQPQDTLDTIAQEFEVSVIQLQQINELSNSIILPGLQLVIPFEEDRVPYGQFPATIPAGDGQGGGVDGIAVVVIQPQGTIDAIAQEYNVSTTCIIEANGIANTRNVRPGTEIVVPTGCPPYGGVTSPSGTSESEDEAAG